MAPRRSTRSSTKAQAGKDAEEKKQLKLESGQDGSVQVENGEDKEEAHAGEKREAPIELEPDELSSAQKGGLGNKRTKKARADEEPSDEKEAQRSAYEQQKEQAAQQQKLEGGAEELDERSEQAKQKGKDIQQDQHTETAKPQRGTLEKGHIYVLYKPKVEVEDPEDLDDVSKCHVLLLPSPDSAKGRYRLLTMGRKHLPKSRDDGGHEVEWGMVVGVGTDLSELKGTLGASTYETKTRGTRHQPASRVAAQGHYILHSPESGDGIKPIEKADKNLSRDHPVYLAYSISLPLKEDWGEVQQELEIKQTGSFVVQVKNPDAPSSNPRARSQSSDRQQEYPPELRGLFTTRFIPANPVVLLDYTGQELLFISGREHLPDGSEGEVVEPAQEEQKEVKEAEKQTDDEKVIFDKVLSELHIYKSEEDVPGIKALEGEWA